MSQETQLEYTPIWEYTEPPARMGMRRVFKTVLYLVGIFLAECSFLSISFTVFGTAASRSTWIAALIVFSTLSGSLIYFFRTRYKSRCLPWLQYLWWILGATLGAIMAFILEAAFIPNKADKQLGTAIFACIIFLYSLTLTGVAHIHPSLHQQINESVRGILKSMPGRQLSLSQLIARLQTEYPLSDAMLNQRIGALNYIEQIEMPRTNIRICRIKGTKIKLTFPQVAGIFNNDLQQKVARTLLFLNEENVDIGLFLLSKEFEATLKTYLLMANARDKIQIPVKDSPERWKLDQMINWVSNNGVITDAAVLNYLRQTRNDRAHGGMPSLTEKLALMLGVQYLANLYIDYIKLLDDLTRNL